ncbi:hypothetical protein [Hydrogenophaga defluvii]|uniref:Transposase-like protein DUF772 n=1 Tax=Hydrogenophaga defluvii TaxID=249410 RepID=A0ABW2S6S6_9BURK
MPIRETTSPESTPSTAPDQLLLERLSFLHFAELLQMEDSQQRARYEAETLQAAGRCVNLNVSHALKRVLCKVFAMPCSPKFLSGELSPH